LLVLCNEGSLGHVAVHGGVLALMVAWHCVQGCEQAQCADLLLLLLLCSAAAASADAGASAHDLFALELPSLDQLSQSDLLDVDADWLELVDDGVLRNEECSGSASGMNTHARWVEVGCVAVAGRAAG
jgi:hypothetical protein